MHKLLDLWGQVNFGVMGGALWFQVSQHAHAAAGSLFLLTKDAIWKKNSLQLYRSMIIDIPHFKRLWFVLQTFSPECGRVQNSYVHITGTTKILSFAFSRHRYSDIQILWCIPVFTEIIWDTLILCSDHSGNTIQPCSQVHVVTYCFMVVIPFYFIRTSV